MLWYKLWNRIDYNKKLSYYKIDLVPQVYEANLAQSMYLIEYQDDNKISNK